MSEMLFKVLNFAAREKNTLRGFLDIETPSGMIVHGISLHERDGNRWLGLPAQKFVDKDGQEGFSKIIEFTTREAADQFRDQTLQALNQYRHGGRA